MGKANTAAKTKRKASHESLEDSKSGGNIVVHKTNIKNVVV